MLSIGISCHLSTVLRIVCGFAFSPLSLSIDGFGFSKHAFHSRNELFASTALHCPVSLLSITNSCSIQKEHYRTDSPFHMLSLSVGPSRTHSHSPKECYVPISSDNSLFPSNETPLPRFDWFIAAFRSLEHFLFWNTKHLFTQWNLCLRVTFCSLLSL